VVVQTGLLSAVEVIVTAGVAPESTADPPFSVMISDRYRPAVPVLARPLTWIEMAVPALTAVALKV
jgi:hypothetical protein